MSTIAAYTAANNIIRTCAHRAPTRNEAMPDNIYALPSRVTLYLSNPKPAVLDQGWEQFVKPSKKATNLWDVRVWRNGRVVSREGLTADQVATFDCEAEWQKGLNR